MAFMTSKTTTDELFDKDRNPVPQKLKNRLTTVATSFFTARMRNLDMFEEVDRRLYGYMTYYDSNGFCWIQPMRTKSQEHDVEYDRYIKRINRAAREDTLSYLDKSEVKVGMNIVARYEVDGFWYRAVVVDQLEDDQWHILFVDFGNLQRSEIYEMKRPIHEKDCDHFHSALQAVCCRLYNIKPNSPADQEKIDIALADFYAKNTSQILEVYAKNIRPDFIVDCDIFLPERGSSSEDHLYRRHIGQSLVDHGLASFADPVSARAIKTQACKKESATLITIDEDREVKTEDLKLDVKFLTSPRVITITQ